MHQRLSRRSVRLPGHLYMDGTYLVTICAADRRHLFGSVRSSVLEPSPLGRIVEGAWFDAIGSTSHATPHAFAIMPNHVHFVVLIELGLLSPGRHAGGDSPSSSGASRQERPARPGVLELPHRSGNVDSTRRFWRANVRSPTPSTTWSETPTTGATTLTDDSSRVGATEGRGRPDPARTGPSGIAGAASKRSP
jgi:hypothetical protein